MTVLEISPGIRKAIQEVAAVKKAQKTGDKFDGHDKLYQMDMEIIQDWYKKSVESLADWVIENPIRSLSDDMVPEINESYEAIKVVDEGLRRLAAASERLRGMV